MPRCASTSLKSTASTRDPKCPRVDIYLSIGAMIRVQTGLAIERSNHLKQRIDGITTNVVEKAAPIDKPEIQVLNQAPHQNTTSEWKT